MNIQDLMDKRAKAWEAAKAFLDAHRNENGLLSAEDGETYDRMEKEITDYTKEIDRLNRQAAIEEQMGRPTATPLTGKPGEPSGSDRGADGKTDCNSSHRKAGRRCKGRAGKKRPRFPRLRKGNGSCHEDRLPPGIGHPAGRL